MSKKRCSRCGRVYPSSYRSCPYCAEKGGGRRSTPEGLLDQLADFFRQHGERIFLITTAVFLAIAVFGMILTRCSDPAAKPASDDKTQTDAPQEEDPQPPAEPLAVSQPSLSLFVEDTAQLTASGGSGTIVWTSSDDAIASVSGGVVTAKAAGTATVTASSGTERAVCVVTVAEKEPEVEVYLIRKDFTLLPGETSFQMLVKVKGTREDYEGTVTWSSADTNVVTVTETGLIERVGRGNTTVTATVGSKTLECIVRVS